MNDMNNLYVISNDNPIQQIENAGLIQDRYDLTGIDDSLPLDLGDSDGKKMVERRYHKRFQLNENTYVLIRTISAGPLKIGGKSMGCGAAYT